MNQLEAIFNELGITQYLGVFIDQGFDTWDTILDITESDLDALGVKLGHRRKLQRRIANYRSLTPIASLTSPTRTSIEDTSTIVNKNTQSSDGKNVAAPTKRRYRRHPRPDGNAPERPPSAYVLFSNKMRDDLKGQNLSFTEIAKLVGENWQSLNRGEKEYFETQAQTAKDRYNNKMGEYKKTDDYRKYSEYLQEFRKRQATQEKDSKDSSKRLKSDNETIHRGSSSSVGSLGISRNTSGTGSGSDSQHGSEPPPTRQQRMTSVPAQEPHISPIVPPQTFRPYTEQASRSPRAQSHDEAMSPRARGLSNPHSQDHPAQPTRRHSGLYAGQTIPETSAFGLPSLTSPAPLPISHSPEAGMPSVVPGLPHASSTSTGSVSSRFWSGPPSLRTQTSSSGSVSSYSPVPSSRTPSEASLPIHALLSSKPEMPPSTLSASSQDILTPLKPPISSYPPNGRPPGQPLSPGSLPYNSGFMTSSAPFIPSVTTLPSRGVALEPSASATPTQPSGPPEPGLDGMSALLRASDIVGRQKF